MGGGGGGGDAARSPRMRPSGSSVDYDALPFVLDSEQALRPEVAPVHPDHGSNVLLDRTFVWGEVDQHFAQSPRQLVVSGDLGAQLHGSGRDFRCGRGVGPLE